MIWANILGVKRWRLIVLTFVVTTNAFTAEPALPIIDTAARYYGMSSEQVRQGYPVRIEGVVLYSDSSWRLLWMSDQTGTLFHYLPKVTPLPRPRYRALLTGRTALINGAQKLVDVKFQELGPGRMPAPIVLTAKMIDTADSIFKRVMVGGTVMFKHVKGEHLLLYLSFNRTHQIRVVIPRFDPASHAHLIGAKVELTGFPSHVPETLPPGLSSLQLFVPDMQDVVVYRQGPEDRFDTPLIPIANLAEEHQRVREPRLIHIRGTLGKSPGEGLVLLEAGKHRVKVRWAEKPKLKTGAAEASGFVWKNGDGEIILDRAIVRQAQANATKPTTNNLPILQSVLAIRGLSVEQARRKYPVDIHGVVTFYDRAWRVLFVQDATGGIYVEKNDRPLQLKPGDRVRIRGVSDPGGFAPMILAGQIDHEGHSELSPPRAVSFGRLISGAEDSQWVTIEGTAHAVSRSAKNLRLKLLHSEGPFEAVVPGESKLLQETNLVGARLRMTGVCGIRPNAHRQPIGILMHVPTMEHVEFLDAPPKDPFAIAATPLERLLQYRADGEQPRLVKVNGIVTYSGSTGLTAIQDTSQAILIKFPTNRIPEAGDLIEVLGFPAPGRFSPTLRRPRWQRVDTAPLPEPVAINASGALSGEAAFRLVSIEATVIENHSDSAVPSLTLQDRGIVFSADISAASEPFEDIVLGSRIRLSGVCNVQGDEWNTPHSFTLLVPRNGTADVLEQPPWLTKKHVTAVAGSLGIVSFLALLWVITLRSRVTGQTRQISAELDARRQLSERYNELVENAGDLIFTLGTKLEFTALNRAAERAFGRTRDELLNQPVDQTLEATSADRLREAITALSPGTPGAHLELRLESPENGILDTMIRRQPHADGSTDIQCIARNITRRRQLEEQIRQMQKMESVGQLAAGIAHDYNNLMTIIMGNVDLLLEEAGLQGENANLLDEVHAAASRASRLTGQLMAFSRKQIMKAVLLNPGEVVRGLQNIIKRTLGETVEVTFEIPDKLPAIMADRGMIEQVVVNLSLNARDAMPNGGTLHVVVAGVTVTSEEADAHRDALPGEHVRISIQDTGVGMEPAVLSRIFEPFFTTKQVGKGTGLGLSTVFGIAKQHQGWVEVESTAGRGSSFHVFFPTTDDTPPPTAGQSVTDSDCHGEETILLVEDSERVRETMKKVLVRAGYHVLPAEDGPNARGVWREHRDVIDLLITDMVMPGGMSGRDLAAELQQDDPNLPVVFCSGYSDELSSLTELTERERILPKPFENRALLKVIRDVIDSAVDTPL